MDFIAIDVETANANMATICQLGLAQYVDGVLVKEYVSYINPEDYFDGMNIAVHGINESMVEDAPTFPAVLDSLRSWLEGSVLVCHTHFDRVAMHQAADRYGHNLPEITWLDSARVARRTWEQVARKGYGLGNVCSMIGYEFQHHDALEDAKAAAQILLAASDETGLDIEGWLKRVKGPIDPNASSASSTPAVTRDGNLEGPLYGEVLVFTGALLISRREAADLAASIGCQVTATVTKKTTVLVVGDQDVTKLAGHEKSSKHRKAEGLIQNGVSIRILRESDFKELVRLTDVEK